MTLGWLALTSFGLATFGMFLFMLAVFAGGGAANNPHGRQYIKILDFSLFALPGSCLIAGLGLWVGYFIGGSHWHYLWLALPILSLAAYLAFMTSISRGMDQPKSGCSGSSNHRESSSTSEAALKQEQTG